MDQQHDQGTRVPAFRELRWPTVLALREMGGSGTIQEINERAIQIGGFTDEQQGILHGDGPSTEIEYRLAWARTYAKMGGAVTNSGRGIWSLTEKGRTITKDELDMAIHEASTSRRATRRELQRSRPRDDADVDTEADLDEELGWKDRLLESMLALPPDSFERLAQRLLREAGFISVTVTGRTGDEGIDGLGVYRLSLVSFPIFFQCKRYRGSVRAGAVRDFRGAMAGRGDKGLLITTGTFTADAKHEATREGAPPIDLIDGDQLCELLKQHRVGVRVTPRTIEDVEVDSEFFAHI